MESNKGQDKTTIWDGDKLKFVIVLKKFYACIILKNNSKGLALNCLDIVKYTFPEYGRQPIKGLTFVEDPWSVLFQELEPKD